MGLSSIEPTCNLSRFNELPITPIYANLPTLSALPEDVLVRNSQLADIPILPGFNTEKCRYIQKLNAVYCKYCKIEF